MKLTDRDIQIIDYMKNIGCISSSQIQRLFNMSNKIQSRRMNTLMEEFSIKKMRYNPTHNFYDSTKQLLRNENIFYIGKKSKCIEHDLLLNEFYISLQNLSIDNGFKVLSFDTKFKINVEGFIVIPDARLLIRYKGVEYEYLIELENNKSFNYKKYYSLEQKGYYCCPVLVITNRIVQNYCKHLELIKLRLNLSNIDVFIKDFTDINDNTKPLDTNSSIPF